MTESPLAKFSHQLRQRSGARTEVCIDFFPRFLRWTFNLLRPIAARDLIFVRLAEENAALKFVDEFR